MNTYLIMIFLSSILFGWSLRTNLRLLAAEQSQDLKQLKIGKIRTIRHLHNWTIVLGIIAACFLPGIWPVFAAAAVYVLIVNVWLSRKAKNLVREIHNHQDMQSIFTLKLGHAYNNPKGATLKLWFIPCQESWPLAKIEVGIGYISLPLEHTLALHLNEHFAPRLAEALKDARTEAILLRMKNDLLARGVTHPIDIQGWNHHPVIRDLIERILSAEPQDIPQPQSETIAA